MINLREEGKRYEAAFTRRDVNECSAILDRILKANPGQLEARLQRARLMGVMCRFKEAHDQFAKVVQIAPTDKKALVATKAGALALDLYDPSIALELLQTAIGAGATTEARLLLAEHLIRMRREEEALSHVECVLKEDHSQIHARFLKAKLQQMDEHEKERELRSLSEERAPNPRNSVLAAYELAKLLDKKGDYDGAIEALKNAKSRLSDMASTMLPMRDANRKGLMSCAKAMSLEMARNWKSERFKPLRGVEDIALIAGHPRSGTTLLEQIIDSHSQTQSAEEVENFMIVGLLPLVGDSINAKDGSVIKALDELHHSQIDAARKAYRSSIERVMPIESMTTLLVDKNPSLSSMMGPFARVFPEAKIIGMIRDPRDVVLSCFFQPMFPLNPVSVTWTDLEEAACEYAGVMEAYAVYAKVLEDSVMEIRYEDMVADVESAARKVTSFLGQQWEDCVLDFHTRAQDKIVRSPTADAVTEPVHTRAKERWKNYSKHLEPCLRHLEPYLEKWGYA